MKKILALLTFTLFITGCTLTQLTPNIMQISSSTFKHKSEIPSKYTCDGDDINPPLIISEIPENTQSLPLIADDPDAPAGTWVHWVVWNIDPSTTEIAENSVPAGGIQGVTSFGNNKYGGPCPPSGTHRYFFKLYALDSMLEIPASSDKAALEAAMEGHIIDKAELMGTYSRS